MTSIEKKDYYHAVFNVKLRTIVNDGKKENSVIVGEISNLLNYCDNCRHCKADLDSAELKCMVTGGFNFNDLKCKREERYIRPNCYTI
jgi:hypothetical protein